MPRLFALILIPVFMIMLIGSYREIKRHYDIENDFEFISKIAWLLGLLSGLIWFFSIAVLDAYWHIGICT